MFDYLNAVSIHIPPLRYRSDDLRALVKLFIAKYCRGHETHQNGTPIHFTEEAWECLLRYDWPGNVRELAAVVQSAMLLS